MGRKARQFLILIISLLILISLSYSWLYMNKKSGLDKIKHGVYGKCQTCQEEIESERLEANPSARTCKKHME